MTDRMTNVEIEALCEDLPEVAYACECMDWHDHAKTARDALTAIRQLQTERDQSESAYSIAHDQATMNGQELNAIRQLQNPWMPIETAPREEDDCTTILLLCHTNNDDYHGNIYIGFWGLLSPESGRMGWCDWGAGVDDNLNCWQEVQFATHWMPLPPAPETGE